MDMMDDTPAELSPLEQRRAALRALSDDIMETIKGLPKPQSWLEGERAMRCIASSDRVVVQLFSKVRAPTQNPPKCFHTSGHAPAPRAPDFTYQYDDDDIGDTPTSDGAQTLDAVLDAMEGYPRPAPLAAKPAPKRNPASAHLDQSYHQLAQALNHGRDLIRPPPRPLAAPA